MAEEKTQKPPVTKILSETHRELEEGDSTSSKQELAGEYESEPGIGPEGQPFIEPGEPGEPGEGEPTHDPLKDTQAKLTQTAQELAEQKKILQAVVANQGMGQAGPGGMGGSPSQPPSEFFSPEPTEDEMQDSKYPARYTQRMMALQQYATEQREIQGEMRQFVKDNPKWVESLPEMQRIKDEDPYAYVGQGAVPRLYEKAQEKKKYAQMETTLKEVQEQALAAGVKLGKQAQARPFTSPQGAGGGGGARSSDKMPADFHAWSTTDQKKWMVQHGLWKSD